MDSYHTLSDLISRFRASAERFRDFKTLRLEGSLASVEDLASDVLHALTAREGKYGRKRHGNEAFYAYGQDCQAAIAFLESEAVETFGALRLIGWPIEDTVNVEMGWRLASIVHDVAFRFFSTHGHLQQGNVTADTSKAPPDLLIGNQRIIGRPGKWWEQLVAGLTASPHHASLILTNPLGIFADMLESHRAGLVYTDAAIAAAEDHPGEIENAVWWIKAVRPGGLNTPADLQAVAASAERGFLGATSTAGRYRAGLTCLLLHSLTDHRTDPSRWSLNVAPEVRSAGPNLTATWIETLHTAIVELACPPAATNAESAEVGERLELARKVAGLVANIRDVPPRLRDLASRALLDVSAIDFDRRHTTATVERGVIQARRNTETSDDGLTRDAAIAILHHILSAIAAGKVSPTDSQAMLTAAEQLDPDWTADADSQPLTTSQDGKGKTSLPKSVGAKKGRTPNKSDTEIEAEFKALKKRLKRVPKFEELSDALGYSDSRALRARLSRAKGTGEGVLAGIWAEMKLKSPTHRIPRRAQL